MSLANEIVCQFFWGLELLSPQLANVNCKLASQLMLASSSEPNPSSMHLYSAKDPVVRCVHCRILNYGIFVAKFTVNIQLPEEAQIALTCHCVAFFVNLELANVSKLVRVQLSQLHCITSQQGQLYEYLVVKQLTSVFINQDGQLLITL